MKSVMLVLVQINALYSCFLVLPIALIVITIVSLWCNGIRVDHFLSVCDSVLVSIYAVNGAPYRLGE